MTFRKHNNLRVTLLLLIPTLILQAQPDTGAIAGEPKLQRPSTGLSSVVPPLSSTEHRSRPNAAPRLLPKEDTPFIVHVRIPVNGTPNDAPRITPSGKLLPGTSAVLTTLNVTQGDRDWVGTDDGLYFTTIDQSNTKKISRHPTYGIAGPLSNNISGIAVDSRETLWVATPAGLSSRDKDGKWSLIRGREGLPWEELTCIAIDSADRIWLGSTRGLIQYRPRAGGRRWYYRAGQRYLPDDHVLAVVCKDHGRSILVQTQSGWSRIKEVARTLHGKAESLETRYQQQHRRLGMPSPVYNADAPATTPRLHGHQASDALWTSYHVAAMCMAYSLTHEQRYRDSAKEGMEALYFLQNVTGIKGVVARSVVAIDEPEAAQRLNDESWHLTSDEKFLWRDDVSSDQYTGHYFAFYVYHEHIARHDPVELKRLQQQLQMVTDGMLDNEYQIVDWDGKVTKWGWLNPEAVNNVPSHYLENGIYSLMMLSFLKTAHHITELESYREHYRSLIENHRYLSNLLLQKKVFPDELNHSDDQLSALLFYSYLLLEHDPVIQDALHRSLRRHARVEQDERNSLFAFVYASVDSDDADVAGGIRTLREWPLDRRNWQMNNSHRTDVRIDHRKSDKKDIYLLEVLSADERDFQRWNLDPYRADSGADGSTEGTGVQYLLPYWMARYHQLIAAP